MFSREKLAHDFRRLVDPGDVVMLHASARAVGEVLGGPDQIHLALKDALTADGTLMMYLGCPSYYDDVGRGFLSPEQEAVVIEGHPPFDAKTARAARSHGIVAEFFRSYPGTLVNEHVARFGVWGRHAEYLISEQPWDYALGRGSALERFVGLNGKVMLLGCDHDSVTLLHYVEHVAAIPGKRVARFKVPLLENGRRVWRDVEEFDSSGSGVHPNHPEDLFLQILDAYLERTNNRGSKVGNADTFVIPAQGLVQFAEPVMLAVAADATAAERITEL